MTPYRTKIVNRAGVDARRRVTVEITLVMSEDVADCLATQATELLDRESDMNEQADLRDFVKTLNELLS